MIPNYWYAILESHKVKKKTTALTRFNQELVLWRDASGTIRCMNNRCPHRGVRLDLGLVKKNRLVCKYHGFEFDTRGACAYIPCDNRSQGVSAALRVNTYTVREENQLIWLWWGDERPVKPPVPWIAETPKKVWLTQMSITWPQHYCRSIETNFDGSHFPFVHNSVMPNLGKYVDKISCETKLDSIFCTMRLSHVNNNKPGFEFNCEFKAPNLSLISFGEYYGGLVIDTPINNTQTWRYMRLSKFPINLPIISNILGRTALFLDYWITQRNQDQRIISTMEPKLPYEGAHNFVRADLGIARYRILRRELIQKALENFANFPEHVKAELIKSQDLKKYPNSTGQNFSPNLASEPPNNRQNY